jgi:hypothetical protein
MQDRIGTTRLLRVSYQKPARKGKASPPPDRDFPLTKACEVAAWTAVQREIETIPQANKMQDNVRLLSDRKSPMRRSRHAAVLAALGIVGWSGAAEAAFTDLQFGKYQVADSQWNPGQCTTTDTCSISSKVPGVAYKIPFSGGQVNWGANNDRYIAFVPNTGSNAATYPLQMTLFEADGTVVESLGTGRVLTAGLDANGDSYFFFIGNDEWTGQLFSGSVGMDNNGPVTLTGTLAPTLLQLDTFSANMSTAPLAAGEVFTPNVGGPEPVPERWFG